MPVLALVAVTALAAPAGATTVGLDALDASDQHAVTPWHRAAPMRGFDGATAANIGDLDGDGRDDLGVVTSSFGFGVAGEAWVVLSPPTVGASVTIGGAGWRGMRVAGAHDPWEIAGLPDVNGDGVGEIALEDGSRVVVVFGRTDGATVDVSKPGDWGFVIDGGTAHHTGPALAAAGDQNGDGRADLAVVRENGVRVYFTPANPAGLTLDDDHAPGFTLTVKADFMMSLADAGTGDGSRHALMLGWSDADGAHAAIVTPPDLREQASPPRLSVDELIRAGHGWAADVPGVSFRNAAVVHGHAQPGIALMSVNLVTGVRRLHVVDAPGPGRRVTLAEADATTIPVYSDDLVDVGDQNWDNEDDIAIGTGVYLSGTSRVAGQALALGPGGDAFLEGTYDPFFQELSRPRIVDTVPDRNGDGRPELVTLRPESTLGEDGALRAAWHLDVYDSAPTPVATAVGPPIVGAAGDVTFAATFATGGGTRSVGARALVRILSPATGRTLTVSAPDVVDANSAHTEARVTVPAASGLRAGQTYRYRVLLESSRGGVGATAETVFTMPGDATATAPAPDDGWSTLRGTAGRDRLVGSAGRDRLLGLAGADVLRGDRGADRLDGGSGRDVIDAGAGSDRVDARDGARDRVDCGPGHDTVIADRADVVRGCEVVRRR